MILRLGAARLSTTPLDFSGNLETARQAVRQARTQGVHVLVLPELCLSGYGCEDAFLAPWVARRSLESLQALAREAPEMVVVAGLPLWQRSRLHNAAAVLCDGAVQAAVCKRHLAREGLHYEPRWFSPWPSGECVAQGDHGFPVGDMVFSWNGVRIGIEICEDAWAAHRPGLELVQAQADLVLSPSASHFALGKDPLRRHLVLDGSRSLGVAYAYANLCGNEAGRVIYDGGCRIALQGRLLAEGSRLGFSDVELIHADIDIPLLRSRRSTSQHAGFGEPPREVLLPAGRPSILSVPSSPIASPVDPSLHDEFARATALGLWDYLRKSASTGFVLSLSGGADSAACAVLVHLACHLALTELGEDAVRRSLPRASIPSDPLDARILTRALLLCVYQPTRNSGEVTREAARAVAEGTGARFRILDVDALVQGYLERGEEALERKLSWESDDLALQNIQARVRAPSVWLLANATGSLLLSTSNRSEMAVGYATMDGDTAGSLSPLAGIDKHSLLGWLQEAQATGTAGLAPLGFLSVITAQAPTAELRPASPDQEAQTDEADLMPYPLLSRIEELAIAERRSPLEVARILERDPVWGSRPDLLKRSIGRFFRLWTRNQWKRERYAPSFHLDGHNLDPRSWCRFPILSGGFESELRELEGPVG